MPKERVSEGASYLVQNCTGNRDLERKWVKVLKITRINPDGTVDALVEPDQKIQSGGEILFPGLRHNIVGITFMLPFQKKG